MSYTCRYNHKHRTETAVEYCHVATPWREKEALLMTTPWQSEGTTEEWSDLGRFRAHFWALTRWHIMKRDQVCQYEHCGIFEGQHTNKWQYHTLEVHHIIPRRLGGTDHPANLISLCHDHHRIQPAHHFEAGLVLCDADKSVFQQHRIRQARPDCETTIFDF